MKGAHGTGFSYAQEIQKNGFVPSRSGLRGSGVYFWSYLDDDKLKDYAHALALAWWAYFKKTNRKSYRECADKRCVVIHVDLQIRDGIFLDLEGYELRNRMISFCNEVRNRLVSMEKADVLSKQQMHTLTSKAYDLFLSNLEQELGNKADIVHVAVIPPEDFAYPIDLEIRGNPSCYVVRNMACINIKSVSLPN